jgi:hypothetical protein
MAGEIAEETPEGNDAAEIIGLLRGIKGSIDQLAAALERYAPALDKAAALVDSPAARLARKLPGGRAAQPWRPA